MKEYERANNRFAFLHATSCTIEVLFIFHRAIDFFAKTLLFSQIFSIPQLRIMFHICEVIADRVSCTKAIWIASYYCVRDKVDNF